MEPKSTRANQIREALADDIIAGRIPIGTHLDEARLAQQFSVSRTPIREALRDLATTGLVRSRAHRGAVVAVIPGEPVTAFCEAVAELEAVCARLCALKMTAADRSRLQTLHRAGGEHVRSGDAERYHYANAAFHEAIRQGSHNPILEEFVATMRNRFTPLSRAQFREPSRLAESYAEHEDIMAAILRGDAAQAHRVALHHGLSIRRAFVGYAAANAQKQTAAE
jgi:DNA-binding GntR family transcriptional regulator